MKWPGRNVDSSRCRLPNRERGATLLEAVAFLGVAAIVVSGVLGLFNSSFTSAAAIRLNGQITSIANNVRDLYSGQSSYAAITMGNLAAANVFPATLTVTGSGASVKVTNQWGGKVTVYYSNPSAGIKYEGVPTDICVHALGGGGNWSDVQVNNVDLATNAPSLQQAENACNAASGNQINWLFQ